MKYFKNNIQEENAKIKYFGLTLFDVGVWITLNYVYVYTERPLPLDERVLFKIIGGKTKKYRESLERILSLFYTKTDQGYINHELDEYIKSGGE